MIKKPFLAFITISAGLLINCPLTATAASDDNNANSPITLPTDPISLTPIKPDTDPTTFKNNNDSTLNQEEQVKEQPANVDNEHNKQPKNTTEKSNDTLNNSISEKLKALTKNNGKKRTNENEQPKETKTQ
jgi:hypothetical protein